jgi:tetratricopeptide (TPR) repeat protein
MTGKWNRWMGAGAFAAMLLCGSGIAAAQDRQGNQSQLAQQGKEKQPAGDKKAPVLVLSEEDLAFKAFDSSPASDTRKKIELGEAFAQKYPQSRYLTVIYPVLTMGYLQTGQVQKMLETGDKAIEVNPNEVQIMATLGQTIPRAFNPNAPDASQQLDKAERYSKRAIELMPTLPKPETVTEEAFTSVKNVALAMAHSGLGLVYVRRGKFQEAIPELEQSVKVDPNPDPVNYYLLGMANLKTSHFEDAAAAYTKCAAIPSGMQATCKAGAEEAKKLGATQLSAPK